MDLIAFSCTPKIIWFIFVFLMPIKELTMLDLAKMVIA